VGGTIFCDRVYSSGAWRKRVMAAQIWVASTHSGRRVMEIALRKCVA